MNRASTRSARWATRAVLAERRLSFCHVWAIGSGRWATRAVLAVVMEGDGGGRCSRGEGDISGRCTIGEGDISSRCSIGEGDISSRCSRGEGDISGRCSIGEGDISSRCFGRWATGAALYPGGEAASLSTFEERRLRSLTSTPDGRPFARCGLRRPFAR